MSPTSTMGANEQVVHVSAGPVTLEGNLSLPVDARGLVLFAHGSGSSRHSPRNRHVAKRLNDANLATLLIDLLTAEEEPIDQVTAELRFNLELLSNRLIHATDWLAASGDTSTLRLGYFGSSTGAGAALMAAAERPDQAAAVVSRGGRPDLAAAALPRVRAPTLLVVGGADTQVIALNRSALAALHCEKKLAIVPGATHLFEEPGALDQVADLAIQWFLSHLTPTA
ncbi:MULTISPECIES: dienelactone hydrolase family protein [unclassified Sinorhizobium]|uniref:dienelactone hydrolase family protein n=1 Tax=unclassified Sinorhizobium TaxID=2613772 RepID=UPI0035232DBF